MTAILMTATAFSNEKKYRKMPVNDGWAFPRQNTTLRRTDFYVRPGKRRFGPNAVCCVKKFIAFFLIILQDKVREFQVDRILSAI